MVRTSNVEKKKIIREYLVDRDIENIKSWAGKDRTPLRTLASLLFEPDPLIAWRAVEAIGVVAGIVANSNMENVKRQLRSLLWLMNDESGSICWNAPEAIGEILYNVPSLIDEFGIILPNYFVEEPFEKGSRWALARIAGLNRDAFGHAVPKLIDSLDSDDAGIKAFSIMILKSLGDSSAERQIKQMVTDQSPVEIYDYNDGELKQLTLGDIANNFLQK